MSEPLERIGRQAARSHRRRSCSGHSGFAHTPINIMLLASTAHDIENHAPGCRLGESPWRLFGLQRFRRLIKAHWLSVSVAELR